MPAEVKLRTFKPLWLSASGALLCAWLGCAAAADRAHVLNVYAWAEYFPPSVVAKFEAASGIHVNYAVLDSPEMAETILSAGNSNYDLVTMNAAPEMGREIPKGFWKVLDRSRIPNVRNADPKIMQLLSTVDPGNQHAVPWMWGTTGLIYDPDKIKSIMPDAPIESLGHGLQKGTGRQVRALRNRNTRLMGRHHAHGGALPRATRAILEPRAARRGAGKTAGNQAVYSHHFNRRLLSAIGGRGSVPWPSAIPAMP